MNLITTGTKIVVIFITAWLPGIYQIIYKVVFQNTFVNKKTNRTKPINKMPFKVRAIVATAIIRENFTPILISCDLPEATKTVKFIARTRFTISIITYSISIKF